MANINAVNSSLQGSLLTRLSALRSTTAVSSTSSSSASPSTASTSSSTTGAASSASISAPGQLFNQLLQLSQSNPAAFKSVASQVAAVFKDAAGKADGTEAPTLAGLAKTFDHAAQTGKLESPAASSAVAAGAGSTVQSVALHAGGSRIQKAFADAVAVVSKAAASEA